MPARFRAAFALLFSVSLGSVPVGAQEASGTYAAPPQIRPATFWWDASLGSGSLQVSCDICADAVDSGVFAEVGVGAYATPRLAVGVDLGAWTHLDGDIREQILQAALAFRYARDHSRGLHFLAGAGWMAYRAEDFRYDAPRLHMGVGWSIPVTSGLSVGNRVVWDVAPFGSLNNQDNTVAEGVRMGLLRVAVFIRSN